MLPSAWRVPTTVIVMVFLRSAVEPAVVFTTCTLLPNVTFTSQAEEVIVKEGSAVREPGSHGAHPWRRPRRPAPGVPALRGRAHVHARPPSERGDRAPESTRGGAEGDEREARLDPGRGSRRRCEPAGADRARAQDRDAR